MALVWLGGIYAPVRFAIDVCGLEVVLLLGTGLIVCAIDALCHNRCSLRLSPRLAALPAACGPVPIQPPRWASGKLCRLTPHETRIGLVMWGAHAMLLILLLQRLETREDAQRLMRWIAVAGIWLALARHAAVPV